MLFLRLAPLWPLPPWVLCQQQGVWVEVASKATSVQLGGSRGGGEGQDPTICSHRQGRQSSRSRCSYCGRNSSCKVRGIMLLCVPSALKGLDETGSRRWESLPKTGSTHGPRLVWQCWRCTGAARSSHSPASPFCGADRHLLLAVMRTRGSHYDPHWCPSPVARPANRRQRVWDAAPHWPQCPQCPQEAERGLDNGVPCLLITYSGQRRAA